MDPVQAVALVPGGLLRVDALVPHLLGTGERLHPSPEH